MDRLPFRSESLRVERLTCKQNNLVTMIEALHATILKKADLDAIRRELDALARYAERKFPEDGTSPKSSGNAFERSRRHEHEAFLLRLNLFRRTLSGDPDGYDLGQLYDFLSEWLIGALCED